MRIIIEIEDEQQTNNNNNNNNEPTTGSLQSVYNILGV